MKEEQEEQVIIALSHKEADKIEEIAPAFAGHLRRYRRGAYFYF